MVKLRPGARVNSHRTGRTGSEWLPFARVPCGAWVAGKRTAGRGFSKTFLNAEFYGYEGATLLMASLTLEPGFSENQLTFEAELSWLVCREDCIPGWASLDITLPVSDDQRKSVYAETFATTREQLPEEKTLSGSHEITTQHINLRYSAPYDADWSLLPLSADIIQHNKPQASLLIDGQLTQTLVLSDYFEASKQPLLFLLTDGKQGYYLTSTANMTGGEKFQRLDHSLLLLALMVFVGGLILNLMPCVLPILSIKALSLQQDTSTRIGKLGYPLGVPLSFNAFAVLILLLKQSGEAVGWGFHMQEPWVVTLLEWTNHECPYVQKHYGSDSMQSLQRKYTAQDVVWLSIISSAPGKQGYIDAETADQLTSSRNAAPTQILFDPEGKVGKQYGARTTPHMFIIDKEGTLRYAGSIDSIKSANPADIAKATNYVDEGLTSLLAGQAIAKKSSSPYGCSVKY